MTTTTTPGLHLSQLPPASGRAGLRGAIASEFTKIRSVRSTYWTLAVLALVGVGLGALISAGAAAHLHNNPADKAGFDATQRSLGAFFYFGQLVIAVLGALVITAEYSTGMIRSALTAMPRRGAVYAGKAIVFTLVSLVVSLVTSFAAFAVGQAIMSGTGVSASLFGSITVPGGSVLGGRRGGGPFGGGGGSLVASPTVVSPGTVLTAVIGTAIFVTLVAVIAFGVGAIVRHTAGTITIVIGVMFVVPILLNLLPDNWHYDIMRFLPDAAGQVLSVTVGSSSPHLWSAWPQLGVTAAYAVVLVAVGAYLFRKRDA